MGVSFLSFINFTSSIDKNQLALQSQRAMYEIDRLSAQLYAAQNKARSYLTSGEKGFLNEYLEATNGVDDALSKIRSLVSGNTSQLDRLTHLEPLVREQLRLLAQAQALRISSGVAPIDPAIYQHAKDLSAQIETEIDQMLDVERRQLSQSITEAAEKQGRLSALLLAGVVGGFGFVCIIFILMAGEARLRRVAEADLQSANAELERRVEARTKELQDEIIERQQAGKLLRASEALYRQVVELSHEAIWIHKNGVVVLANDNAARMFGFSAAQNMIGQQTGGLVHPEDQTRAAARTSVMLKSSEPAPLTEMKFLGSGGRTILLEVQATPFEDRGSISVLAVGRDITDRRRLEDQLRHAQKLDAIGQLTGGIAHDFNNLLSVVIGNLDSVLESADGDPKHAEMIRRALDGALHGAELTHRLLGFARRLPLEPKALAINDMLPDVVTVLKRTLGEAISIELKTSPDLWPALADASQVQDALLNLAINARDAMPQGGKITIQTANARFDEEDSAQNPDVKAGHYAMLAVTDTGSGMTPEVLKHVMEPFFTTKPVGKGTGLGLSMIYGFAQQSGGHLKIYSEAGRGTTVRLYLPRAGTPVERPAAQTAKSLPRGNETILVVEDNPALRKTAIIQLSDLGYQIVEAANGEEAVLLLRGNGPIDLLFSDIVMTGKLTGADVALEAERLRPSLKVLLSTGYAERTVEFAERQWPVLNKPYRKRDLAAKVREILDERRKATRLPKLEELSES